MTADQLHAAFRDAYRGNEAAQVTTAKQFWTRWAPAFVDAPGVEWGAGAWTLDPDELVADPLAVEVDGRPLRDYDYGDYVARMYDALADGARTDWGLAAAAAPQGRSPNAETVAALNAEPVVAGRTAFDMLTNLPGVDAPDRDAPLLRYADDDGGEP